MRMTHSYKLSRRMARHRAPLLAALILIAGGCNSTNSLDQGPVTDPSTGEEQSGAVAPLAEVSLASASTTRGIAMGTFGQPVSAFGSVYSGAMRIISPPYLLGNLAQIKARGGRVMLDLAGNQNLWKDAQGHFSMTKWKARIDRFKGINFSSYINDGTIIGHYVMDEPDDPANWNGVQVSPSVVEEMARYSKQLWPNMATVVRSEPSYMSSRGTSFRYLDAAWAQYTTWRRGTVDEYVRKNIADAQRAGLALVVGLNISKGNNHSKMTPTQVRSWGASMLNSSYPCTFLSWTYSSDLLYSSAMKDAMSSLRSKAENRSYKTCRS